MVKEIARIQVEKITASRVNRALKLVNDNPYRKFIVRDNWEVFLLDVIGIGETADGVTDGMLHQLMVRHGPAHIFTQFFGRFRLEAGKDMDIEIAPVALVYYFNIDGEIVTLGDRVKLGKERLQRINEL